MGRDKAALRDAAGQTLLQRAVAQAAGLTAAVYILGRTAEAGLLRPRQPVHWLPDATVTRQGPLAGLATLFEFLARRGPAASILAVAVDMPNVQREHLRLICEAFQRDPTRPVCATGTGSALQPFPGIYPAARAASLREAAGGTSRGVTRWLAANDAVAVPLPADAFQNLNTPDDWQAWSRPDECK